MRRTLPRTLLALAAVSAVGLAAYTYACGSYFTHPSNLRSPYGAETERSVAELRRAGPAGLRAILAEYDRTSDDSLLPNIDAVAAQRDARWSRLFWYTNLDEAKSAAAAEHKPILALRMLGNLTDEYSCANSRFFRTALYANSNVSQILRDRFILVWTSERPVPVVTIDYGDGRVLKRTITGNSIHYILNSRGEVIDALPGLYDPETFASLLVNAAAAATANSLSAPREHIERSLAALAADWTTSSAPADSGYTTSPVPTAHNATPLAAAKAELESPLVRSTASPAAPVLFASAADAADRAVSKTRVERPLVKAAQLSNPPHAAKAAGAATGKMFVESPMIEAIVPPPAPAAVPADVDSDLWSTLAQRRHAIARLDQNSINLIRSQNPNAYINTAALDHVVNNFQNAIAIDTLRNNHLFRRQILNWLLTTPSPMDALNTRVYSELFLTPRSDPWLGLVPDSTYSALTGDGCSIN